MTTLINPANGQRCAFVRAERGYIALDTTQVTRAIRWFSEAAIDAVNPVATCAEPPKVTCTTLAIWRPTIEIPITELGNYSKGVPGISVAWSSVNLVLRLPVAA